MQVVYFFFFQVYVELYVFVDGFGMYVFNVFEVIILFGQGCRCFDSCEYLFYYYFVYSIGDCVCQAGVVIFYLFQ